MYLKKLEITGFKSFPEKVEFTFSPGITAAVGPNGCGKSNLLDAVRWVLGSQSARLLRGAQMDELIFSGTAKRRAMNYAEVSLSLAGVGGFLPLDYDEVVITRRMYRSGEGEYYINKNPCRLRDIVDLFLDTGIGMETYSLIGQGRVEQLINARPEEHRELFEEVARIHKYRRRKKETLGKLEEAAQNLLRVEDLLLELKNQQEPLADAVSLAKRYRFLRSLLREVEEKILARQWVDNNKRRQKIQDELARIDEQLREQEENRKAWRSKLDDNNRQEQEKKERVETEQALLREHEQNVQQLERKLAVVREQKNFSLEKRRFKENAMQEVWERISGLDKTLEQNRLELQKLEQEQREQGERAATLKEKLKLLQAKQELPALESLRRQVAQAASRLVTLNQALQDKETRCVEINETMEELSGRIKKVLSDRQYILEQEKKNAVLQERLRWEEEKWVKEQSLLAKMRQELESRLERAQAELQEMEKEQEKKRNRARYLRESEENLSYYAGGVRAVMQAVSGGKTALSGIHGPLVGLITVPPFLEKAIEVTLGGAMQYIVTDNDAAARCAIEYLKKERAGRATFLPLNLLRPPQRRDLPADGGEGLLGIAAKLVEAPDRFRKAVDHLLGNVLVAANLDTALKLAHSNRGGWKLVTLDGEVITPGGAISGGYQPRENPGFLQRKRELEELLKEISARDAALTASSLAMQEIKKEREQIYQKIAAGEQEGRELTKDKLKLQGEGEHIARELKMLADERQRLEQEMEKWQGKLAALAGLANQEKKERDRIEKEIINLQREENRLGERVRQSEEVFRCTENELVELRVRFSAIQEKESSLQEQRRRHIHEKSGLQGLAAELVGEKERLQAEWERLAAEEGMLAGRLEEGRGELKRCKARLLTLAVEVDNLVREKTELSGELEKVEKDSEKYTRRSQQLQLESVKLEEAQRYLEEQLREKYDLDPIKEMSVLQDKAAGDEPAAELTARRDQLGGEIAALGTVNTAVIDEYERLQERITFLETQQQDLQAGEKGIKKVLAELDRHMKEQFLASLSAVEKHFNDVFQQLFGGGQALLRLADPQNVLDSGIEITAQPPGKNLKNISLLSGGEKALTAIALLFALLYYRPVPFCILDEIDSSLDDNNAGRFISYLKSFARETQFILITHRRQTMEEADVLYGITMEEEGVSKVISLDLKQKAG